MYISPDKNEVFKVHTIKGVKEFIPHDSGFHYLDLNNHAENSVVLATTVGDNFEGFTKKQVKGIINVQRLQVMLEHPFKNDYESMVCANLIDYCQVIPRNIFHAYELFGKNLQD